MAGKRNISAYGNKVIALNPSYEWADEAKALNVSSKELEVFALLMDGHSNQEIAEILGVQPSTVANHISSLYQKLKAKNMAEAMKLLLFGNFIKVETFFDKSFDIQEWIKQTKCCIAETPVDEDEKENLKQFLIEHGLHGGLRQDNAGDLKIEKITSLKSAVAPISSNNLTLLQQQKSKKD